VESDYNSRRRHEAIQAICNPNNCHKRRAAKREDPSAFEHYDPETFFQDEIRQRSCRDVHFMLFNMIQDVSRKFSLILLALREGGSDLDELDPAIAARLSAYDDLLGVFDRQHQIDWEGRAEVAWRIHLHDLKAIPVSEQETLEEEQDRLIRARAGEELIAAKADRLRGLLGL
jgi:hypothetical protein